MNKLKTLFLLICLVIPFALVGCENKNKDTLSVPTNLSVETGNIIFDQVTDAEYYTIMVNETEIVLDAKYSNNVEIIDNKINYNASKVFVVGESYTVKVKANAKEKNSSDYTSPCSYKHIGSITKPKNVKINETTLTWDMVENASYYLVKIITPNDNYILSHDGTILTKIDSASIQNADLTEYSFYTNQFNFGSLLSNAGVYSFYVSAVHSEIGSYVESGYTDKVSYTHNIQLYAPINGQVGEENGSLYLSTVVDANTKILSVSCGDISKEIELNGLESELISKVDSEIDNFYKINLSKCFSEIDFNNLKQHSFKTKSVSTGVDYYLNSSTSNTSIYEKNIELSSPTAEIMQESVDNLYIVSWNSVQHVSRYSVLLFTSSGLKTYSVDANTTSMLINEEFLGAAIIAEGSGNYISSKFSNIVYPNALPNNISNLNARASGYTINWNAVADYYLVELNNKQTIVTEPSFTLNTSDLTKNNLPVNIVAIKSGSAPKTTSLTLNIAQKLSAPVIEIYQGFNSSKLYELTFTGVNNAFGYYVYIKSGNGNYIKINKLFTSTKIDLTNEIISKGEYSKYTVKVQAVADPYSNYINSEMSIREVSVTHAQILTTPSFDKIKDENGQMIETPIIKSNDGKYYLKFSNVTNANKYEILINNNVKNVDSSMFGSSWIEIDVTDYMIGAGSYNIKVRAIPKSNSTAQPSAYAEAVFTLKKQLETVTNVQVSEIDGVYTLSFNPVDNAQSYRIRIVKENDAGYVDYLKELGLSYSFETDQAADVTDYVKQHGVYYFYVTALAPKSNSHYIDAIESKDNAYLDKLETLEAPKQIEFKNNSEKEYLLTWTGDYRADYYRVKVVDPQGLEYEFNVFNQTYVNINDYITVQGEYTVFISAMIDPKADTAKYYTSSASVSTTENYRYKLDIDFLRYSVYMYGENYNFNITNVTQLKNLLWYHYLYPTNNFGLSLKVDIGEALNLRQAIISLADEANGLRLYDFANDQEWLALTANEQSSNNELFSYLCKTLIKLYPEYNILDNDYRLTAEGSQIFNLSYSNALNTTKRNNYTNLSTNTNYGNDYKYIDLYSRRSSNGTFKIDSKEEMLVTTTEQLLQVVTHGKKPKFIGDSSVAETVYNNAKLVLSAIVSNNMSDTEKVTAIFDWLEYGYDLAYYNIDGVTKLASSFEYDNLKLYGLYDIYYLESIFSNITMENNGNLKLGNSYATSKSYSKAFALLCGIEGITSNLIYGEYTYSVLNVESTVEHVWNVVKLNSNWYSVDLTFSDNRIYFNNLSSGYGISSHIHFLNSKASINNEDSILSSQGIKKLNDNNHIISSTYPSTKNCISDYDYYGNSQFGLTYEQIKSTIYDFAITENGTTTTTDFKYLKTFNSEETYQKYAQTTGYGPWQSYLLNMLIYAGYKANENASGLAMVEFSFKWSDNKNSNIFDTTNLLVIPTDFAKTYYNLKLNIKETAKDANNQTRVYQINDAVNSTSTIIFIVEKSA